MPRELTHEETENLSYDVTVLSSEPAGNVPATVAECPEPGTRHQPSSKHLLPKEVLRALNIILEPGSVTELRALGVSTKQYRRPHVESGYFDDVNELASAAERFSDYKGLYIVPNPVAPALLARAANRVIIPNDQGLTTDADVIRRRWLMVDLDPCRISGISSSEEEHDKALALARTIRAELCAEEWPEPILADSGNGAHLLFRVDLPTNDHGLTQRVLEALDRRFSNATVDVDKSTHNPARLIKLYGSLARKGDHTDDRPHRHSQLLDIPEQLEPVPIEILEKTTEEPENESITVPGISPGAHEFNLESWIAHHGLDVSGPKAWKNGRKWVLRECVWNQDHRDGSAFIIQFQNGAISAGCLHNSCRGKEWSDLREVVEGPTKPNTWNSNDFLNYVHWPAKQTEPSIWPHPSVLRNINLPEFPTETLPDWLQEFVIAEAVASQTPTDLAGMLALATCSAATAGKFRVETGKGVEEPINLYTVVSLPPGNRKSSVFREVVNPLVQYESELGQSMTEEVALAKSQRKVLESRLSQAEANAAKSSGEERLKWEHEVNEVIRELTEVKSVVRPRLVANDATPEKLIDLLHEHNGRMALLSAEGEVFDLMGGRYSNGVPNLDVYVKGHPGDPIHVDRLNRDANYIDRPSLTIGVTVQPEVLNGLMDKPGMHGRGVLARFLYSLPASPVGNRDVNPPTIPDDVRTRYRTNICRLIALRTTNGQYKENEAKLLSLSTAAHHKIVEQRARLEPKLGPYGELAEIADWAAKFTGALVRIAGILHLAEHVEHEAPWEISISLDTVERAVHLGENYLIDHALAAYAVMGADLSTEAALQVLRWIETNGKEAFSKRDAHNGLRSKFPKAQKLDAPLDLLVDHGYIREVSPPHRSGSGRPPSPMFEVNPRIHHGSAIHYRSHSSLEVLTRAARERQPTILPN